MIRLAVVKEGGLISAGTEKFLQTIAAHLPRDEFSVDYYYSDPARYCDGATRALDTSVDRYNYMTDRGVNLVKFRVGCLDAEPRGPQGPTYDWRDTDFWELFDESKYDLIQTGRGGPPVYPFMHIRRVPIVDSLHGVAGVDNQFNIARVMHVSRENARRWIEVGGAAHRVVMICPPIDPGPPSNASVRRDLGLAGRFVCGFHQRADDGLFSDIPLAAFALADIPNKHFMLLGGGNKYKEQSRQLGISDQVSFVPYAQDQSSIRAFLAALDVYAHGRKDGEMNSSGMAEAMCEGLPIVSHTSEQHNGHVENIGAAGQVLTDVRAYATELERLYRDVAYREWRSSEARKRFKERYELQGQMRRIAEIYVDVMRDPFPNPLTRRVVDPYRFMLKRISRVARDPRRLARLWAGPWPSGQ